MGTCVLRFGWDLLFETAQFQLLIYSGILIVLMLVLPNGLLSLVAMRVRENVQMALYSHAGRLRSLLSRFGAAGRMSSGQVHRATSQFGLAFDHVY
eukprot:gene8292-11071_t